MMDSGSLPDRDFTRDELVRRVLDLQTDLFRSMRPSRYWLEVDLTMPQLKVLFLLYAEGSASMGYLAHALGVTLSTVTGIVDRLVEHRLVRRQEDPQDRRLVVCRLTDQGHTTAERLHQAGRSRVRAVLADLSAEDLQTVVEGYEVLAAAVARNGSSTEPEEAPGGTSGPVAIGTRGA